MDNGDRDLRNQLDGLFFDLEVAGRSEEGRPTSLEDVEEDITERLFAEQTDKRAEEQQAIFRDLVENAADAIVIGDLEGHQIYGNRACYELFDYDHESQEMTGLPLANFWPEEDAAILTEEVLPQALAGSWSGEVRQKRRDGTLFDAHLTVFPVLDEAGQPTNMAAIIRGVAKRKRLEYQVALERRARQVQTSADVAQEIAAAPTLDELYRRVVTLVKERFGYYHAQLFLLNEKGDKLETVAGYGEVGRQLLEQGHFIPMGKGAVGRAGARGEPVLSPDASQDPEWVYHPLLPDAKGELAVPVKLHDEVVGVLDVQSDTAGALTEEDQIVFLGLAGQIASAIEKARLFEQVQARAEREQLVRAITDRIRQGTDTEAIMRITLQELGQMLGASKSIIRLGTREQLLATQETPAPETKGV